MVLTSLIPAEFVVMIDLTKPDWITYTNYHMTDILQKVSRLLHKKKLSLVSAESCTGGWVAKQMTDLAGSSEIFDRGFVTYSNQAKQDMLGVSNRTLDNFGAVSKQVVIEMVEGALISSEADIGVSISGIAGPGGGTIEKPVGLVWFAWMIRGEKPFAEKMIFKGDRNSVRQQAVDYVFKGVIKQINGNN